MLAVGGRGVVEAWGVLCRWIGRLRKSVFEGAQQMVAIFDEGARRCVWMIAVERAQQRIHIRVAIFRRWGHRAAAQLRQLKRHARLVVVGLGA